MERTLCIIKPDAMERGLAGKILTRLEQGGFRPVAMKLLHLTMAQAEGFYQVHRERPFFESLTRYMSSGRSLVMVLEKEKAISELRSLMGATEPAKAEEGSIRKELGQSIERNSIHGSDGPETAAFEISYFFGQMDLFG